MRLTRAYLAGVFDSDGSFTISQHRRTDIAQGYDFRTYAQITWKWSPEAIAVLNEIKTLYGGSVLDAVSAGYFKHGTRTVSFRINAKKAAALIRDILPHLRIKRRQAELCYRLASEAKAGRFNRWHPKSDADWSRHARMCDEVRRLNAKNGKGRMAVSA